MKQDIRLFIDNKEVDFSNDLSISFTYQLEDFNNPTIVKNSFSKSIKIKGTDNNNKIFGEIYNLDRKQLYKADYVIGVYFDPSKRTPFQLFKNGDLIESGYMQLNNITINKKVINYDITLYGGLGDFFYNIMYNKDSGDKLTLADLQYFVEDDKGNVLPSDKEFDFDLNQDMVYKCFNDANGDGKQLHNFLTFVPSYNGLYEDFDNEACLINTYGSSVFTATTVTDSGTTYETYNGFALGKLNKPYTEWEIRDLRSYMQRPAIRLQKLIETICRPENNGGYNVLLDEQFFNSKNPYWSKSYIALPLFNNENNEKEEAEEKQGKLANDPTVDYTTGFDLLANIALNSEIESVTYDSGVIDYSALPKTTNVDIDFNFSIYFNPRDILKQSVYYLSAKVMQGNITMAGYNPLVINLIITDENDVELYKTSKPYRFEGGKNYATYPFDGYNYVYGQFEKIKNKLWYKSYDNGANTFSFQYKDIVSNSQKIKIKIQLFWTNAASSLYTGTTVNYNDSNAKIYGKVGIDVDPNSTISFNTEGDLKKNTKVTKRKLLKTENSPTDYLLDYCKLFGLYISKDLYSNTITISTRNSFFKNKIVDWSDKIDLGKDLKIEPIIFNKKFYTLSTETPETYFSKKYKNEYQIEYGQQRMNTQYNFNNENTNLYENNIYENVISCQDNSIYFRNFFNKYNINIPAFLTDNMEYQLFYEVGTENEKNYVLNYNGTDFIDLSKTVNWSNKSGYDVMAKTCFYTLDNNEQNLSDISNTLLLYNGDVELIDNKGYDISYWITDDLVEMSLLNDKSCYIYTERETDSAGRRIARRIRKLPQFIRYIVDSTGNVNASLDFGVPREIYINNITYNPNATIYSNFWKNFYNDQFNIDTKKITCYVNLQDEPKVNDELLKQFYYFNNSYWILNKIDNYDANSYATTRCEFIKVQDISNYLQGQFISS